MIALVRVDNRLIHGQVVSTWIPHLKVGKVVVVDDEAAASPLIRAAMTMAVPPNLDVQIASRSEIDWNSLRLPGKRVLVLVRDVGGVEDLLAAGVKVQTLNLGNVHHSEGRKAISASVFLSQAEIEALGRIADQGVEVEARALPSDHALGLADLRARYRAAS